MPTDPFSPANQPTLIRELGMYSLPYASTWPELRDQLAKIYREKAADISWLPPMWFSRVMSLHGTGNPAVVMVPASSKATVGISFLDTPAKKIWWDEFSRQANNAIVSYASKQAEQGRVLLDKLYADTKFWDTAINLAQFLATPVTVARTVIENPWKSFGTVAAVGVAALLAYLYLLKRRK